MATYLELDIDEVTIDPDLVKQVPYGLAMYYLALPVGEENGQVSVALAHPENTTALATLGSVLQAEIVPVRGHSEAIRSTIQRLHGLNGTPANRILAWSATPERAPAVQRMAAVFAAAQGTAAAPLDAGAVELDVALTLAQAGQVALTVMSPRADQPLNDVVSRCATPLILVRGDHKPIERILVAIRGFASDDQLLDWLAPLARAQQARVALLPLLDSPMLELEDLLCIDGPAKRHLDHLLQRLTGENVSASLRIRPGDPVAQIVAELSQGDYDLLIIAAEAHGQFVTHVLDVLDQRAAHLNRPIFILKPTDLPANTNRNNTLVAQTMHVGINP